MGVGSTVNVCMNFFTSISPLLAPLGARLTMTIGSVLMSLGIILASFSTEVWHLYLTQGALFGIGSSLIYMSIVTVIPQWFTAKRGTAMGIITAGTGFGGLALSPMVISLVNRYGLPWAYRIIGLMAFAVLFGFICGLYFTLAPPITAAVVIPGNISSGLSILFVVSAIAATGAPIASAIQEATPGNGYTGVQMFSGAVYIFGSLICILLKFKMTGSFFSNM